MTNYRLHQTINTETELRLKRQPCLWYLLTLNCLLSYKANCLLGGDGVLFKHARRQQKKICYGSLATARLPTTDHFRLNTASKGRLLTAKRMLRIRHYRNDTRYSREVTQNTTNK